jgi:hypothetical protein
LTRGKRQGMQAPMSTQLPSILRKTDGLKRSSGVPGGQLT